jgi:hypothetical protein
MFVKEQLIDSLLPTCTHALYYPWMDSDGPWYWRYYYNLISYVISELCWIDKGIFKPVLLNVHRIEKKEHIWEKNCRTQLCVTSVPVILRARYENIDHKNLYYM